MTVASLSRLAEFTKRAQSPSLHKIIVPTQGVTPGLIRDLCLISSRWIPQLVRNDKRGRARKKI